MIEQKIAELKTAKIFGARIQCQLTQDRHNCQIKNLPIFYYHQSFMKLLNFCTPICLRLQYYTENTYFINSGLVDILTAGYILYKDLMKKG